MSNVTNINEINKLANEVTGAAVNSLIKTDRSSFTAAQKGGMTGALVGAGIGGVVGAAFVYREEITNFVTGITGGESAGGDAFM